MQLDSGEQVMLLKEKEGGWLCVSGLDSKY